jgi:uncharacterized coiled-coil DUF342 family protein
MSDTPMKLVVDCATGAQTYVPLSAEEIEERELMALQAAEDQAAREAAEAEREALKASARAKLVAGEPLSAEEAALLVL